VPDHLNRYWYLVGHKAIPTNDVKKWEKSWHPVSKRVVAQEMVEGVYVSTVFLGIDHSFGGDVPLLFETMIFPHEEATNAYGEQWRWPTWDAAEAGHKAIVHAILNGLEIPE